VWPGSHETTGCVFVLGQPLDFFLAHLIMRATVLCLPLLLAANVSALVITYFGGGVRPPPFVFDGAQILAAPRRPVRPAYRLVSAQMFRGELLTSYLLDEPQLIRGKCAWTNRVAANPLGRRQCWNLSCHQSHQSRSQYD
jgi:hypothetical protein